VDLRHGRVEAAGDVGNERHLERPRGYDYLSGAEDLLSGADLERVADPAHSGDALAQADRKIEGAGVVT
jgi:hypothetical protein